MSVTAAAATTWKIDATHTEAGFAVKHLMISTVRGRFAKVDGTVLFDPTNLAASSANVSIDVASIDTKEAQRDGHLRSADFFDVEKFPTMTFTSRAVRAVKGDQFELVGDLTIKSVTREVVLDVEANGVTRDPWGGERSGFSAHTKINRKDFDLGWNQVLEAGGLLVGEDVKITLDVELIKQ